jgi:hypothetical protein
LAASENCLYYWASFSTTSEYYALECLGDRIPIVYIKSVESKEYECKENKNTFIYMLFVLLFFKLINFNCFFYFSDIFERNAELKALLESKILPRKSYMRVNFEDNMCTARFDLLERERD